jgi:uncharacterized protein (TIGR03437 family)
MYPVTASFGGIPANVAYAGEAPTETLALQQINIQVSANATVGGAAAIMLTSDGVDTAAGLTVAIQ